MFRTFLTSTLVLKNMFLSSFMVGNEKWGFGAYYNASIIKITFIILATRTHLFQGILKYFYILFGKTLVILRIWIERKKTKKKTTWHLSYTWSLFWVNFYVSIMFCSFLVLTLVLINMFLWWFIRYFPSLWSTT